MKLNLTKAEVDRFWSRVSPANSITGCMEWDKSNVVGGYGRVQFQKHLLLAHRASWIIAYGEVPDNLRVLHSCDNPLCVNIDHLFLGTDLDNTKDKYAKGREGILKGEDHPMAKLSTQQVEEIRELLSKGINKQKIAAQFNITVRMVYYILNKDNWK